MKTKKKSPVILIALICILLAAAIAVGIFLLQKPEPEEPVEDPMAIQTNIPQFAPNASIGPLPGKTEEEIREMLQQQVDDKMVAFSINATPTFKNGSAEGNLMLESPGNNINNIEFVITRDDTGDILYRSGLLKPNSYIETDKLQTEEPLPAGEYTCTATITLYDPETTEAKGMAQAALVISVQN